jgi:hypothetical protein
VPKGWKIHQPVVDADAVSSTSSSRPGNDTEAERHPPAREFDGVGQKIDENLAQAAHRHARRRQCSCRLVVECDPLAAACRRTYRRAGREPDAHLVAMELKGRFRSDVKQAVDQAREVLELRRIT